MATKRKPYTPKPERNLDGPGREFGANAEAIAEAQSLDRVLTVNGKPIPSEFAHAIPYAQTDQGIEEANARAAEKSNGKVYPKVEFVADAWDKTLARKADAEAFDSYDPLREAVDQVREPGMEYRFISERVLNRRGRRGWEPAADANGQPIKVAGLTLGKMPADRAKRRNEHYQAISNDQLENAEQQYVEDTAKMIRESGKRGLAPLRTGEQLRDNHNHHGMAIAAGMRASRGDMGADAAE